MDGMADKYDKQGLACHKVDCKHQATPCGKMYGTVLERHGIRKGLYWDRRGQLVGSEKGYRVLGVSLYVHIYIL